MTHEETRIVIKSQGAPILNDAIVLKRGDEIVAVSIDCKSKYCEVAFSITGNDSVSLCIVANERSLNLNEDVPRNTPTIIDLVDFAGWNILCTGAGRYEIYACLIKH